MNVYDFDGTIYDGDSTVDFYLYCLRKHPKIAGYIFQQALGILRHRTGRIDTTAMKESFFSFLKSLRDADALIECFWMKHHSKIKDWYLEQQQETDLIISASPEFLLAPICRHLGILPPIATQVDLETGKIHGKNCKGAEKAARFMERFPEEKIQKFYSDSLTDTPLALLAESAIFVRGNTMISWEGIE